MTRIRALVVAAVAVSVHLEGAAAGDDEVVVCYGNDTHTECIARPDEASAADRAERQCRYWSREPCHAVFVCAQPGWAVVAYDNADHPGKRAARCGAPARAAALQQVRGACGEACVTASYEIAGDHPPEIDIAVAEHAVGELLDAAEDKVGQWVWALSGIELPAGPIPSTLVALIRDIVAFRDRVRAEHERLDITATASRDLARALDRHDRAIREALEQMRAHPATRAYHGAIVERRRRGAPSEASRRKAELIFVRWLLSRRDELGRPPRKGPR